ncbi:MAG: cyclopropane-fatty-acyl-phospholipid synthase [Solirubrobacteraceae bacterium]|jgi:cyclopropane-fatty-acyl-phospholipid synthase|nr:cyclopropane-fatty-acyl-phospholipid synthase [Solirubrobacteraceae bacterium]
MRPLISRRPELLRATSAHRPGAAVLTRPLRREIARALPERPFALRFWDGSVVPATVANAPVFHARTPAALAHFLRSPGELGLGRAYVQGDLVTDDLDAAFEVVDGWEPPAVTVSERVRLTLAAVAAAGWAGIPRMPSIELILKGERHSAARDAAAVRYHYDVGNEFFALFLDASMTYSCAIFSRGAQTLEEAQRTKLELVASKLRLAPGQRVLDVGCGWGSFAIHAATEHGARVVGITLSRSQAELARRRVAEAGVADQVEIRFADYRELTDGPFDAIASIGMVEHVGDAQIDRYAATLAGNLAPGGRLLNHGIATLEADYDPTDDVFSDRYVFPDGEALPLSRVQLAVERAGLRTTHIEGFAEDYSRTLTEWTRRLDERLDDAERLAGPERTRIWRLYLRAARRGFDVGFTSVFQVLAHKP